MKLLNNELFALAGYYLAAIASAAPATTTSVPNVEEYIDQYVDQYFDQNFDEYVFEEKFPNIMQKADEIMDGITEFHEFPDAYKKIEDYIDQYFDETNVKKHFPNFIKSLEEYVVCNDQNIDQ